MLRSPVRSLPSRSRRAAAETQLQIEVLPMQSQRRSPVTAKATPARTTPRFTAKISWVPIGGGTGALRETGEMRSGLRFSRTRTAIVRAACCNPIAGRPAQARFSAQLGQAYDRALGLRRVGLGQKKAPEDRTPLMPIGAEPVRQPWIPMADDDPVGAVWFILDLRLVERRRQFR